MCTYMLTIHTYIISGAPAANLSNECMRPYATSV